MYCRWKSSEGKEVVKELSSDIVKLNEVNRNQAGKNVSTSKYPSLRNVL